MCAEIESPHQEHIGRLFPGEGREVAASVGNLKLPFPFFLLFSILLLLLRVDSVPLSAVPAAFHDVSILRPSTSLEAGSVEDALRGAQSSRQDRVEFGGRAVVVVVVDGEQLQQTGSGQRFGEEDEGGEKRRRG